MAPVRLEPMTVQSRVKHSTTEPLAPISITVLDLIITCSFRCIREFFMLCNINKISENNFKVEIWRNTHNAGYARA